MQWDNINQPSFESGFQPYFMGTYLLIDAVLSGASEVATDALPYPHIPPVYAYNYVPLCLTISVFGAVKAMWPTITTSERLQSTIRRLVYHQTIPYLQGQRQGWYACPVKTKTVTAELITYLISRQPSR
ncbi:hypothetical protein HB364_13925 [Pseudoflavitalea sp. X16]|uniref:hypothetical protein n=1 Tax=Paraflavitalea devenefica TaxID=2716334 RepID=UPI001421918E|nr:hypothetical protein [Paraflavitalea devenefica]NII26187.1 hypothetical protein [Paraflavitalea devenefica]